MLWLGRKVIGCAQFPAYHHARDTHSVHDATLGIGKKSAVSHPGTAAPALEKAQRKGKAWLWLAVERASRCFIAWVLGRRGHGPLALSRPDASTGHCAYFTDRFPAYTQALPNGYTGLVRSAKVKTIPSSNPINCSSHQCCAVLVRSDLLLEQITAHACDPNQNLHPPA